MHVAIITSGGAGMFCGSCMHDNTWARALMQAGEQVTLIPTYTPIRVDEDDLSARRVFFGGINVYLAARSRLWRRLPRFLKKWFDRPALLRLVSRLAISNDASELGDLTLAMLAGEAGPHREAIDELVEFLTDELKPDVICFSNALLVGSLRTLRAKFDGPIVCTLQGDDIFLESLPDAARAEALKRMSDRMRQFDGFLVHSNFYRDRMARMLNLPADRFFHIPLGIDTKSFPPGPIDRVRDETEPFRVGYFARICPEKGLGLLLEAFRIVHREEPRTRLVVGGYLGPRDRDWFETLSLNARDLGDAFEYIGSPAAHDAKVEFLRSLDLFSAPTVYQEPKGISILEALACGIPVVQPAHGTFPEMLEQTGGGLLCRAHDAADLAENILRLIRDPDLKARLAREGHRRVVERFSMSVIARDTQSLFQRLLQQRPQGLANNSAETS